MRVHDYLWKAPPRLAQVYGIVSELIAHMHKSYDMCRAGTNSDTFRTECASQGGGLAQVFRARAHDLWKPKTLAASLECMRISSALALLVPHGTTDHEGLWFNPKWQKYEYERKQRVRWETKQRGMEDFFVRRIRSRKWSATYTYLLHIIWNITEG